jgi:hypothetical protein
MPATDPAPTRIPHAGPTAPSVSASPATTTAPASPAPAGSAGVPVPVRAGAAPARVRSAAPVRWAFAGVLAVVCAVAGVAAGLAGCGLSSTVITGTPPVQQARTIAAVSGPVAERAAVARWLAAASRLWLHHDAAAFDRLTTAPMRRVYRDAQPAAAGGRVPLRLTGLFVAVPCQAYRASVFVAYARTDAFAPGQRPEAAALVFTRHDRTWRLAAAVTSRSGQWPALCQALNPCVGPAVLPPPAYPRFLAHELGGPRIRYSPGAAPVLALPLAGDRGYWVLATVTGHGPQGARFSAIYAATDPAQAAGGHVTLNASLGARK